MNDLSKVGLAGLALALALSACTKETSTSTTTTTDTTTSSAPADTSSPEASASSGAMANGVAANDGAKVYQTNCSSCHQPAGTGADDTFPPLAGNPVVNGPPAKVIHIVKYGLNGKIQVKGHSFNGMMPAWSQQLSDADIASVITYVRSSWGNSASAVTEADVKAVSQ